MIRFYAQPVTLDAAAPDGEPPRTITGVAVPWDTPAIVSDGTAVQFTRGAFDVNAKPAKLIENHDMTQLRGTVVELVDDDAGLLFTARFARTRAADEAIELVKAGALDSVSVGAVPVRFKYDKAGTMIVAEARLMELSLVPYGAFAEARIDSIAASSEIPGADAPSGDTDLVAEPQETPSMDSTPAPVEVVEATIPTAPIPAQPKRQFAMPSIGEYMAAYHIGGDTWKRVNAAAADAAKLKQTAFEAAIQAAAGDTTTSNTPGLLNVRVLGPVFEDLNYTRPAVAAVGVRAMPDNGNQKTFIRPTWTTHPTVAQQSNELDPVSATTPVIASNVITKQTRAGGVTLSVQDIDFTSPAAMETILRDIAGQYLFSTDDVCADAITAGATASGSTWTVTANDPSSLIESLYDAAADIMTATNFLPDTIFVSVDVWKKLGQQLDADKRPVFAYTGAAGLMGVNGMGSANITQASTFNPFGLRLVPDRNFAAGTMVVARTEAIEFYEQVRGLLSVEVPSTLGRSMSYYGYVATFIADGDQVKSIVVA